MKKLFLSALLALGALLQAAEIPDSLVRPGRFARIGNKTVISATAENTQIVIAPKAPSTVRFAAQELQFFLSRILGKDIPVVRNVTPGKVSFILGDNVWSRKAGIELCFRIYRKSDAVYDRNDKITAAKCGECCQYHTSKNKEQP